ncbi:MAG TPA: MotA/TolQ/ExbB proton channel family protein [Acidobacteriota bacterium]|nr:MotA/TolQ/ExbB proton channel family protein [Acidobacteriota bacterium]
MDLGTIIGIILGIVLVTTAIMLGGDPKLFINVQGMLIVVGGTVATTLVRFPMPRVLKMMNVVKNAFTHRLAAPDEIIEELIRIARIARKEGVLALEEEKTDDEFLQQGILLVVDGNDTEAIEDILRTDIRYLQSRHRDGRDILKAMGESAPAFGMIGTLIGLVIMLANMEDVSSLGPAMAVAILTTLYGALIANVLALPLAKKLEIRSKEETLNRQLMLVGLLSIQKGDNPRIMETVMRAFLRKPSASPEPPPEQAPKQAEAA